MCCRWFYVIITHGAGCGIELLHEHLFDVPFKLPRIFIMTPNEKTNPILTRVPMINLREFIYPPNITRVKIGDSINYFNCSFEMDVESFQDDDIFSYILCRSLAYLNKGQ